MKPTSSLKLALDETAPHSPVEIARSYIVRHWNPIPIRYKTKEPTIKAWQKRTISADNVELYFNGQPLNIGVQLGPKSSGLADVDLDCPEAVRLARYFLPETDAIFGRASKPNSHALYYVKDAPPTAVIKLVDGDNRCIIELRLGGGKKGAQTIFPGSVHESGELIKWTKNGEPARVSFTLLERVVRSIAVASLLLRHWPGQSGGRHDLALCLGGVLARVGQKDADISRFIEIVAHEAGDSEFKDRNRAAADSAATFARGEPVWGRPKLGELLGKSVANTIAKLLRYSDLAAKQNASGVSLDDFNAYMPMHNYIYMPTREPWPGSSVNARLGSIPLLDPDGDPILDKKGEPLEMAASAWLDRNKPVEQMTWAPGLPSLIKDRLISDGGWIERLKVTCLNLYRPPNIVAGDAAKADPWLEHILKVFGDEAEHITKWLAHRVQRPQEKINHALVLGGKQGIGKDTLLEPVKYAVGPWNFMEVSPQHLLGRFNGFLKSVILRVNEARDLGDVNRFQFYDHMKAYTATPPDVLRVDEKHLREHNVLNCCGIIITTNHKADGIFLPPDDRRHYVAWSDLGKEDFVDDYWRELWSWYAFDGVRHVTAYLNTLDLSAFDPKAPPPKTPAFWDIVNANRSSEDSELADVLDLLENPDAVTIAEIRSRATGNFGEWINDRKNRRLISHRFEACGYVPVRNDTAQDGLWKFNRVRQVIYGKATLPMREQLRAARELINKQDWSANRAGQ